MQRVDLGHFRDKKVALVLSGGVVKAAAWHLGVALALEELGFTFKHNNSEKTDLEISTYVGSSAGSLINLYFASGYRPIDIIEAAVDKSQKNLRRISYRDMLYLKRPIKAPPRSNFYDPLDGLPIFLKQILKPVLTLPGIFSTHGLHKYLTENIIISSKFEDYAADMFVVATQLDHSRKVIFSKYNYPTPGHDDTAVYYTDHSVPDTVAASMSVPPFYAPYPLENPKTGSIDYYIDGEIRDTLSTHVAMDNHCEFIISSWTHTPYHYHDEIGSLINYGLPAICTQAIFLMIQKKIVSARARRLTAEDLINTVSHYMKSNKFTEKQRQDILGILESKLHYRPNVHLIDIYPKHDNYKAFFSNSFSLNPKKTSQAVSMGYKRTMEIFKHHEWES